uniref:Transmembrane protein 241 n=1 Tax=Amphilophus citrinellus TaxID=61819 RepID=A0A3Q0T0M7_AMPCI
FVLSVLKFTYPTLFQWQTFIGAVLLLLSGKLGWVEMSRITSAALSWLPGSFLFVGNIYAGSRALSRLDIPFFFTLQNCSHVVSYMIFRVIHRQVLTTAVTCGPSAISPVLILSSSATTISRVPWSSPPFSHTHFTVAAASG